MASDSLLVAIHLSAKQQVTGRETKETLILIQVEILILIQIEILIQDFDRGSSQDFDSDFDRGYLSKDLCDFRGCRKVAFCSKDILFHVKTLWITHRF